MTKVVRAEDLTWELPEGFDPDVFAAGLVFDPDLVLDPEVEAAVLQPADPLEKIASPSDVRIDWDYRTALRIAEIAQARGASVAELLEELAELEVARADALELLHNRQGHHDAA